MLVAGKIHNLRLAVRKLDGLEVPAGQVFSFWKQVGRTSLFKGFVTGRELREGCIIPKIGGGLCQLSNALYDAALQAGFEIPVIAIPACGVEDVENVLTIANGDVASLRRSIIGHVPVR